MKGTAPVLSPDNSVEGVYANHDYNKKIKLDPTKTKVDVRFIIS